MKPELEAKLETCTKLPTLSAVALEVMRLCDADYLDLREMAHVIGRDPALAIKIIRTANSPLFALRQEVTNIPQALSILGAAVVRTLVLSFSLVSEFQEEREGPLATCWTRSVFSSISARCLCTGPYAGVREEAFLAALLQDVGMIVYARAYGGDYQSLCALSDITHQELAAAEAAAFGVDHAEVGAWLLHRWQLPQAIVRLVGGSHGSEIMDSLDATSKHLMKVVRYSGQLADTWNTQSSMTAMSGVVEDAALLFGHELDMPGLTERIVHELRGVAPLFQLEIHDADLERWVGGLVHA